MSQTPDTESSEPSDSPSPEEIRDDLEQTREQLGETIDALSAKLDVKQRASEGLHRTGAKVAHRASHAGGTAKAAVTDEDGRPRAAAVVTVGAVVVVAVAIVIWRRRG